MPELRNREPFKTVLSGARAALAKLSRKDLETILGAVLSGMSIKQFRTEVEAWLAQTKQPRWNRPYAELIYQPMLQLLQRLYDEAQKKGWTVISMKKDWKRVFPFE
jgi:hypothetical protein